MKRLLTAALVVMLAACGEAGGPGSADTMGTTPPTTTAPPPSAPTTTPPTSSTPPAEGDSGMEGLTPAENDLVSLAVDDLAGRLDVEPAAIDVVLFERVTWNDGSLGCPQPGMMYTQALVEGWRAVLEAAGVSYAYHAGRDNPPFLCENPSLKAPIGPGATLTIPSDES